MAAKELMKSEDKSLSIVTSSIMAITFAFICVAMLDTFLLSRQQVVATYIAPPWTENDYDVVEYDLTEPRFDEPLNIWGSSLTIKTLTGDASIRFNSLDKKQISLFEGEVYAIEFTQVYLTNISQSGKVLTVFVGRRS